MAKCGTKVVLTPQQEKWFITHFKHTKNEDVCKKLDISLTTMQRLKRKYGLKKSKQFMVKCQAECTQRAWEVNRERGWPPKGFQIPNGDKGRFKPGYSPLERLGPKKFAERAKKSAETRRATFKRERARVVWGLEQKTKLRVAKQPQEKLWLRWYLKKRGYIVDDVARIAYYDENTKRGKRIENKKQPWYKFHERV